MLAQTAQAPSPAPPASSKPQFFAGTVTDLTTHQITVSRTPVGRPTEMRTFVINPKTKMNKNALKVKSRVTVRYQHVDQNDVALEIHLQPRVRPAHPS
jgi:hypothetical protein